MRTVEARDQESERRTEAVVTVEHQDPNFFQTQQLEHNVVGGLIARARVKNELDKCNATRMKLDMLQSHRDTIIAHWRG